MSDVDDVDEIISTCSSLTIPETGDDETIFLQYWCKLYGLTEETIRYLDGDDILDGRDLLALTPNIISDMDLPMSERCLLRGSVLQYFQNRKQVDKVIKRQIEKDRPPPESPKVELPDFDIEEKIKGLEARFSSIAGLREFEIETANELHKRARKKRVSSARHLTVAQRILRKRGQDAKPAPNTESPKKPAPSGEDPPKPVPVTGLDDKLVEEQQRRMEDEKAEKEDENIDKGKLIDKEKEKTEADLNNEQLDKMINGDFEEELDNIRKESDD